MTASVRALFAYSYASKELATSLPAATAPVSSKTAIAGPTLFALANNANITVNKSSLPFPIFFFSSTPNAPSFGASAVVSESITIPRGTTENKTVASSKNVSELMADPLKATTMTTEKKTFDVINNGSKKRNSSMDALGEYARMGIVSKTQNEETNNGKAKTREAALLQYAML